MPLICILVLLPVHTKIDTPNTWTIKLGYGIAINHDFTQEYSASTYTASTKAECSKVNVPRGSCNGKLSTFTASTKVECGKVKVPRKSCNGKLKVTVET